ncbi:MAG: outer membrane beta-barrel protein [Rhodobacteraceae bacterium]|nr:outer membrane beta-barrel protein [Paracoccaceae bacterium]
MTKRTLSAKLIASTILATAISGSAVLADPSWNGFYVGGALNSFPSGFEFDGVLTEDFDIQGATGSVFAGYNTSFGALVVGGEVNAFLGDVALEGATHTFSDMIDLKAKAGTSFGNALVYATVGYSFVTEDSFRGVHDVSGLNYGIGVDYLVTDNIFIGADVVVRNLNGRDVVNSYFYDTSPLTTVSIRAGYKF